MTFNATAFAKKYGGEITLGGVIVKIGGKAVYAAQAGDGGVVALTEVGLQLEQDLLTVDGAHLEVAAPAPAPSKKSAKKSAPAPAPAPEVTSPEGSPEDEDEEILAAINAQLGE